MTYGLDYSVKSLGGVLFFTRYRIDMPLIIKFMLTYIKPNSALFAFIPNVSRIITKGNKLIMLNLINLFLKPRAFYQTLKI